jgi:hypothetical protein
MVYIHQDAGWYKYMIRLCDRLQKAMRCYDVVPSCGLKCNPIQRLLRQPPSHNITPIVTDNKLPERPETRNAAYPIWQMLCTANPCHDRSKENNPSGSRDTVPKLQEKERLYSSELSACTRFTTSTTMGYSFSAFCSPHTLVTTSSGASSAIICASSLLSSSPSTF